MALTELQDGGLPWGSYTVLYYTASTGARHASGDMNVTAAYVERAAERLTEDEVMVATCESQPGGMTAYGSEQAREQWQRRQREEHLAPVLEAEKPWTAEGAHIHVTRGGEGRARVTIDGAARVYRPEEITPAEGLAPAVLAVWAEIHRRAVILAAWRA